MMKIVNGPNSVGLRAAIRDAVNFFLISIVLLFRIYQENMHVEVWHRVRFSRQTVSTNKIIDATKAPKHY